MGLAETVAKNDHRASLIALRDYLAQRLEEVEPHQAAPLAARLADVLDRLAGLPAEKSGTVLDELSARRAADGRTSAVSARSRRG